MTSPDVPSPVTPSEPEVTLVNIPVPAEYRDMVMNRPDYAEMIENMDQRPHMVNELNNSMILYGELTYQKKKIHLGTTIAGLKLKQAILAERCRTEYSFSHVRIFINLSIQRRERKS